MNKRCSDDCCIRSAGESRLVLLSRIENLRLELVRLSLYFCDNDFTANEVRLFNDALRPLRQWTIRLHDEIEGEHE